MRARDSLPASTGLFRFRQWPQMVRELPWRVRVSFLLLWALLSIAILVAAILLTEESRQQQFDATTLHIKKTLEERLLICETAVYGFSELSAANYGMDRQRFRQYAQGIGSRYPYIYLMGFQPKVSLAERENFEASISFQRYQPFFIKDYQSDSDNGWLDNQLWRPATARPFYVPLINAEPAAANRYAFMQGLDILQDRLLGPAVQRAMRSTDIEITRPYRMRDGGHGFGFVKAIYAEGIPPTSPEERMAAAIGIITVGVRAEALLAMQDSSMQPYGIRLLPATPGSQVPAIVLQQSAADSEPAGAIARRLYPPRQSELSIERDYFPYKLSVSRPSSPGHIPWYLYGLAAGASALINALLLLIAASQHNERMQRDRYHDALNRERQQAMITLESIDDAVLVTNRELQVEYLNPKAALLLNTHGPSAVGCQLSELWQLRFDLAREAVLDPLQTCLRSGQQVTLPENAYIEQGGKVFYVEGTISPLPDQGGALRGLVITFRDMAPLRQRMAEALERSEARLKQHQAELARVARINTLGEMTSGIAHEINQPLSAIVSYNEACLGLLEDEEPDRILLISALRSSVKQAQRAGHIVKKTKRIRGQQTSRPGTGGPEPGGAERGDADRARAARPPGAGQNRSGRQLAAGFCRYHPGRASDPEPVQERHGSHDGPARRTPTVPVQRAARQSGTGRRARQRPWHERRSTGPYLPALFQLQGPGHGAGPDHQSYHYRKHGRGAQCEQPAHRRRRVLLRTAGHEQ
ncbi:two-component system sensor histidine kinase DctS [Vogesella perlucida]|nr:two-component system sensor histidine kinase DctS [Vogesella perlucida]